MNTSDRLPWIAVTMGDAAGIGPEVSVRAWLEPGIHRRCQPFAVGHAEVFRRQVRALDAPLEVVEVRSAEEAVEVLTSRPPSDPRSLVCLTCCEDEILDVPSGRLDSRAGRAAYDALCQATDLALAGVVDAIVTAPLSKAGLHRAGLFYPGHTEILAERCGASRVAMMLYLPAESRGQGYLGQPEQGPRGLGVVHATLHVALRDAISQLTAARIVDCCELAQAGLQAGGVASPRIGVSALNPHAGEDGLFGSEEISIIGPAVQEAAGRNLDVAGPLPADTLFCKARQGGFDAIVAMYHDQGHIALKLLGMHRAVNVTLGLPIIRTSPAHGTATDIAGRQRAEASGMIAAIETAAAIAGRRQPVSPEPVSPEPAAISAVMSRQATSRGEYSNQRLSTLAPKLTSEN